MNKLIFKTQKFVTNSLFIKKALELNLSLEEYLFLMYFDNNNYYLDMNRLSNDLGLELEKAYMVFNSLISKKLIGIDTIKDQEGKMIEQVNLDNFYDLILEDENKEEKQVIKTDVFSAFETEFGRTISATEYEIINAWLEKGYSEELIKGALREAVFNGVSNLRYIDKILYEWGKKGYKNMDDVNKYNVKKTNEVKEELFDYNWLDDDE